MGEMMKLNYTLKKETVEKAWIGLQRDGTREWQWSLADQTFYRDGDTYRHWDSGQPDNKGGIEFCVEIYNSDGYWNDNTCNNSFPFVCYEDKLVLINQSLTWKEALRYCRIHHYDLVSVCTEEMQLWVKEVVQNASTEHVWLGLRHTCAPGLLVLGDWRNDLLPGLGPGARDRVSRLQP
ncbi:hypothetical protein AMELA_G00229150 [Ameiurus melas]|uniref:C-type lectin domain-containing protein n=1 Tax=Ameiurus melas TaxID=219545 RepID=A0A7J5ZZ53_AMEME|nr:hypothetical protein AMELA_G00229150 [Ameiurus melas]